ncbi:MAG: type 4a pilus biogenesis protein PilO [Chitinivibrionales bacterium]|nr:type 4a pilus biogenesis protein PilO [Chitinivibrionales bacterium]
MKLLEKLKKIDIHNPRVQVIAAVIVIMIFAAYMYYQKIILIKRQELQQLVSKNTTLQNELIKIMALRPKLEALRKSIDDLNVELQTLREKFPDREEIPQVIHTITTTSRKVGISTTRFIPLPGVEREFYRENNYEMTVSGGYHELGRFFAELANFDLIINLSKVSIKVNPSVLQSIAENEAHGGGVQTIVASFILTTFSSKK